VNESWRSS